MLNNCSILFNLLGLYMATFLYLKLKLNPCQKVLLNPNLPLPICYLILALLPFTWLSESIDDTHFDLSCGFDLVPVILRLGCLLVKWTVLILFPPSYDVLLEYLIGTILRCTLEYFLMSHNDMFKDLFFSVRSYMTWATELRSNNW